MSRKLLPWFVVAAFLASPARAELIQGVIAESAEDGRVVEEEAADQDLVKLRARFQAESQGAGTPNQIGAGVFIPVAQGEKDVFFVDVQAGVNLSDFNDYSSIDTTLVKGATVSTSTRLGYRWLNGDKSTMYGINVGYDSRPMATGQTVDGIQLLGSEQSVFYQQIGVSAEASTKNSRLNAYASLPIGETEQWLNWYAAGGALNTYGLDVKLKAVDRLSASLGYYYQHGDLGAANGSGVKGEITYDIADDVSLAVKGTYDEAFETRISGNIVYRFGGSSAKPSSVSDELLVALNAAPDHRNVRVHDCHWWDLECDIHKIGGLVNSGTGWVRHHVIHPLVKDAEKFGLSASQASDLMHSLESKLGKKVAKWAFKKVLTKVLKLSEDSGKIAEEDTRALRDFLDEVRSADASDGLDGVADVVADNPELTAEALAEAAEIAAE